MCAIFVANGCGPLLVLGIDVNQCDIVNQNGIARLLRYVPNAAHPDNRGVGPRTKRVARGTTEQEVRGRPFFGTRPKRLARGPVSTRYDDGGDGDGDDTLRSVRSTHINPPSAHSTLTRAKNLSQCTMAEKFAKNVASSIRPRFHPPDFRIL